MRLYEQLTDDELAAEIAEYRAALKSVAIGGGVTEVGGEGRRMVLTPANHGEIRVHLGDLLAEQSLRMGRFGGNAIRVEIG